MVRVVPVGRGDWHSGEGNVQRHREVFDFYHMSRILSRFCIMNKLS